MKERDSNIELFRIVATMMILILHCNGWLLHDYGGIDTWEANRGFLVGLARRTIQSLCVIGVDCFVLISGYYSIKPKLKSLINLFTLLFFFYVGGYLLSYALGGEFTWKHFAKSCLAFSRPNWFIQSYLFLMLLAPMINAFVEKCSEKQMTLYTLLYMGCAFYFDCLRDSEYFYFNGGYSVTSLMLIYLVGRYLKLYGVDKLNRLPSYLPLLFYVLSVIVLILLYYLPDWGLIRYHSPFVIVSSVLLFYLFIRLPKFNNKVINWIGVSALSVFICHTCTDTMFEFLCTTNIKLFTNQTFGLYCFEMLGVNLCIFAVSILLDKLRLLLFKPLFYWTSKLYKI